MQAGDWLKHATAELSKAGIGTARLDALVLLEDELGVDRAHILAQPEHELTATQVRKLKNVLKKRASHLPLAYVRGKSEFFAREFRITPAVLEPRPESETMLELLLKLVKNLPPPSNNRRTLRIADVGTGSGALGITAKLELPAASVDLLELDEKALVVAKMNAVMHTTPVTVIKSDLLRNSPQDYDILLCNLPYVPDNFHINEAAQREPKIAIFGGPDGLDVYRRLFADVQKMQHKPLYILTEALPPQHELLAAIAREARYECVQQVDFIQVFA